MNEDLKKTKIKPEIKMESENKSEMYLIKAFH